MKLCCFSFFIAVCKTPDAVYTESIWKGGMLPICVFWGVFIRVLFLSHLHPSLTGFNLGLEVITKRWKSNNWLQMYVWALMLCFCLGTTTIWPLRPVIVLHGVQHTNIRFATPTGREGTYWRYLSLKFLSLKGQSYIPVSFHSYILANNSNSSSCKAFQRS